MKSMKKRKANCLVLAIMGGVCAACISCSPSNSSSFGGDQAGDRGEIQVLFINNTSGRAVFTFGTFDDRDSASGPDFDQFALAANGEILGPDSESEFFELTCGRVLGIGSPQLLANIAANRPDADVEDVALVNGIDFYDADADDEPSGRAAAFEARLGQDFPCGALIVIYLETNDAGAEEFRVDFQMLPSSSSR